MDITPILDPLNAAQREAVTSPDEPMLVVAGAGSGKTRVLVHRIAWLIQVENVSPLGILAVTFTNKAAAEMRSRIEALLGVPAGNLWVGTFHGLAHLCRRPGGDRRRDGRRRTVVHPERQAGRLILIMVDGKPGVLGIIGYKNSGKTTLVVDLMADLRARGLAVSSIKHTHHDVAVDDAGDLSRRLREAGAVEVMLASPERWALLHEYQSPRDQDLAEILPNLSPTDLLLIEGYKRHGHDKIEVHRPSTGAPLMCRDDRHIIAVVTDQPLDGLTTTQLDRGDVSGIVDFIVTRFNLR